MKVNVKDLRKYVKILDDLGDYCLDRFAVQDDVDETVEAIETASSIMNSLANLLENQEYEF